MESIKKQLSAFLILGCVSTFQSVSAQTVTLDFKGNFRSLYSMSTDSRGIDHVAVIGSLFGGTLKPGDPFEFKITYDGVLTPQAYTSYVYMFGFGQGTNHPVGDSVSFLEFNTATFAFNSSQLGLKVGDDALDIDLIGSKYDWLDFGTKAISVSPAIYLESFLFGLTSLDLTQVIQEKVSAITGLAPFVTGLTPSIDTPWVTLVVDDLTLPAGANRFQLGGDVTSLVRTVVPTAVPEPSSYGFGALITLLLALAVRSYRKERSPSYVTV